MFQFNIKLRNDVKKLNVSNLKNNSLKFKFKVKGLYKEHIFKAEIHLIIKLVNNKLNIEDISICDLNISECNSSSDYFPNNPYTLSALDFINNENLTKKIYNHLKSFVNNIQINKNNNTIDSIVFDLTNSKIKKLNIKGYVKNY